jgi:demethylmenaquinone methyltransferase / 2-methoxy-6-polyprenyl-1,4-benzoquinol methylase
VSSTGSQSSNSSQSNGAANQDSASPSNADQGTNRADGSTHFGFQNVRSEEKAKKVAGVFDSVASKYDLMNDVLSGGLHRVWKSFTINRAAVRPGMKVLDIAGGTGDLALAFAKKVGPTGEVWLTDINGPMLTVGRDRVLDQGSILPVAQCDAEKLPFPDGYFDRVSVAFGLRNMTRKEVALAEMHRVLKPGGRLLVLEFSKVWSPLSKPYDWYSFNVMPKLGKLFAGDDASYQYLAESIRMHPDQDTLKDMMTSVGFERVQYFNFVGGIAALHDAARL